MERIELVVGRPVSQARDAKVLTTQFQQGWREENLSILSLFIHSGVLGTVVMLEPHGCTRYHMLLLCTAWKEIANLPKYVGPPNLDRNPERSETASGDISSGLCED